MTNYHRNPRFQSQRVAGGRVASSDKRQSRKTKRKMMDIRLTQFFMRNGLSAKKLEIKAAKSSPLASASARLFPEKIKFGKGGPNPEKPQAQIPKPTGIVSHCTALYRLISPYTAFLVERFFYPQMGADLPRWEGWLRELRQLPRNAAFCRKPVCAFPLCA